MKMNLNYIHRRRVFKNSLVLATTLLTVGALNANDHESPAAQGAPGQTQTERQGDKSAGKHEDKSHKFIKEASMSGKMEVEMGRLAKERGQNQQVKQLGEALVRDHTAANQRLQQIAQKKNVQLTEGAADQKHHGEDKHQKHQQELEKLRGASGAEFDKMFVKHAIKHHKKDIAKFEKCQTDLQDQELTSFIQETLPKLRQHLQMAQAAAPAVGVDAATVASEADDADPAVGAPAAGERGIEIQSQGSLDGATDSDASLNIKQNNPATAPDSGIDADADIDVDSQSDDPSASVDVDADVDDNDSGIFEKGDGKVLGLSTDKQDGKFLGIIPNPRANNEDDVDADVDLEADVDTDDEAVGTAAPSDTGTDTSDRPKN